MIKRRHLFSLACAIFMILAATLALPELYAEAKVKTEQKENEELCLVKSEQPVTEETVSEPVVEEEQTEEQNEVTLLTTESMWAEAYHRLICVEGLSSENLLAMALAEANDRMLELMNQNGDHLVTYQGERFVITDDEYQVLLRIVESEAPAEDIKGKMLVANVVLNRVLADRFPDTIGEVVFQKGQFAPIASGYYWKVTITDTTREAVDRVLAGEDESEGALFFMARKLAKPKNVKWFDRTLEHLFTHGGHEFFKYKTENK